MSEELGRPRIGVLWRGDRRAEGSLPPADRGLGPLYDAFTTLPVDLEQLVPYADDAVDEVRDQLLGLNGVLVWVNPTQDGANRARLDALLRGVSSKGLWVSAHPDVILQIGTKEILFRTRELGWGSDTMLYRSADELARGFPDRLGKLGRLVLKQGRGNSGNGVWKVELPGGEPVPAGSRPGTGRAGEGRLLRAPEVSGHSWLDARTISGGQNASSTRRSRTGWPTG